MVNQCLAIYSVIPEAETIEELEAKTFEEGRVELIFSPAVILPESIQNIFDLENLWKAWQIFEVEFILVALDEESTEKVENKILEEGRAIFTVCCLVVGEPLEEEEDGGEDLEGEREEEEGRREVSDPSTDEVGDVTEEQNAPEEGLGDGGDSFADDGAKEIPNA